MKLSNISGKFSLECEIAAAPWKQALGLSFSRRRRNMLFLFPFERRWEFWMFGMSYGLRIIFIDGRKRVIEVREAEPLSLNSRTWKVYAPEKPCKYVLEIPANSKYKFEEGDKLKW